VTRKALLAAVTAAWIGGLMASASIFAEAAADHPAVAQAAVNTPSAAAALKNPAAPTAESIAAGKQSYTRSCAPCHGTSGEGGPGNDLIPAAPDLTDAMWDHGSTDGEIFTIVKDGIAPEFNMTPFKDTMKDDDIWHVVNYVRSLAKK
jgi:mono/diheme cytochrome c family protein